MAKVMENFIQQNFEAKILKQFSTVCYKSNHHFKEKPMLAMI
jgi:hypothetical protein